jgi:hypothetical protein
MVWIDQAAFDRLRIEMLNALARCRDAHGMLVPLPSQANVGAVALGAMTIIAGCPVVEQNTVLITRMDDDWIASWPPQPCERPASLQKKDS